VAGKLVNLLYVDDQLSEISLLTKQFRGAGFVVREETAASIADVHAAAKKMEPDLILFSVDLTEPSIGSVRAALDDVGSQAPIIALTHGEQTPDRAAWLTAGARDAARSSPDELLIQICRRELADLRFRRRAVTLETMLREADERCNGLLASSREAIAYVHEGAHVYINPAYLELFGYTGAEELEGLPLMNMVVSDDRHELKTFIKAYGRGDRDRDRIEVTAMRSDESTFPAEIRLQPASVEGEPCLQVLILDSSPEPDFASKLAEYHQRDMLTDLFNRQHFKTLLDEAHLQATKGQSEGSLFFVRLDQYRDICERYGLTAGDQVIKEVAELLKESSRPEDVLARYDESTLAVLSPVGSPSDVEALAERIRSRIEEHVVQADSRMITATSTVGVGLLGPKQADAGELIALVDQACAEGQRQGGNRIMLTGMTESGADGASIEDLGAQVNSAIANGQISLTFQPIASLKGGDGERFEVRSAVRTDGDALLPPDDAFPDAVEHGLMKLFDEWAVDQAVSVLSDCKSHGRNITLFLPISTSALLDGEFIDSLTQRLPKGCSLVIQVDEDIGREYYRQTLDLSHKVHAHGCKLAISEFGQDPNAEKLIELLQPDFVKFTSEIVAELGSNGEKREYVDGVSKQLSSNGGQCIADQINSAQHLAGVWQTSLELIQGDFVAPASDSLEFDFDQFVA
jgi:diguanylate cyclase (GGDEF)-like protein/PAS domain S-box-containing protein